MAASDNHIQGNGIGAPDAVIDSDSEADSSDFEASYRPISFNSDSESESDNPLPSEPALSSVDLNGRIEKEEELVAVEEEKDETVAKAFEEDEMRRNAPLAQENVSRVMEAMKQVRFIGTAPDWADRVDEESWLDRLRRLRGALAGFAIAVIFTWKLLRVPRGRPRRPDRVKRRDLNSRDEVNSSLKNLDFTESQDELDLGQIVKRKLNGGRKMTIQLLGAILEETSTEELQKQATVKLSSLEVLSEISKTCDIYLMERVLDDESEERVLSALENAGIFLTGNLTKEKVLFCSTDMGRSSFVRQIEPDWHVDSNLDVVSQLARFIRYQLYISSQNVGQIGSNVFTSQSLEQYFSSL